MAELRLGHAGCCKSLAEKLNDHLNSVYVQASPPWGRVVLPRTCASLNVDVEVLQVAYQPLLQTVGKCLLTSLRFRYLIP